MKGTEETPLARAYHAHVQKGQLAPDPAQEDAVLLLARIAQQLDAAQPSRLKALFKRPEPVRGAYIWGAVGRGKTLLMDLFFDTVPEARKRRVHFHEFMDEVHQEIAAFRARRKHKQDPGDPIPSVVAPILETTRLLCFDEFHVTDITNAMLLQRLFEKLFAGGVTVVATSNVAPDRLYENGLNRQLFLPFIDLLKRNVEVFELRAEQDYRQAKLTGEDVFYIGTGAKADAAMERVWLTMTGGDAGAPGAVKSLGREIKVPAQVAGAARFDFADLCEKPLGARDYLRLSRQFHSLVIEHVPQFTRTRSDAAKRFIQLIDTLYDRGVRLAASFAVPLDELGADDRTAFEFERCVSRLKEMQSADYLSAAAGVPAAE